MANQITVNSGTGNITVTTSRSVIGTVANVATANYANFAGEANIANTAATVTTAAQPNITSVGTLTNLAIAGDISTVDSITLDTAANEAYAVAKMYWDSVDGTVALGMQNNVVQRIGEDLFFYGKASGNIIKGQSVMFAGVQGDHILIAPANSTVPGFRKEFLIGIATQNISNGSFGYVTWFGKIDNLDTQSFATGDLLWFNPNIPGGLTNVEPIAPQPKVLLAAVVKQETAPAANNGVYIVRPTFYAAMRDIQDVRIVTPINGQVLTYDSANSIWVNANVSANVSNVAYAANAGYANVAGIAYSVDLANVVGAGNIASINLTGSSSNVLYGNGTFAPVVATLTGDGGNLSNIQGGNVVGAVANANFATSAGSANIANIANIAYSVDGANVNGAVANATYANTAGVANSVDGANVSGSVANATYANISGVAYSVSGSNVVGAVANATYADNAGNANTANLATYATTANSVAVGNVSGIGNIATINLDGNAGNILYGNGIFAAAPTVSNVANANYANFAGTAFNVSGANVSGAVANATYADNAGNANVANTANSVAVANVSGIGNIATVNLDGNAGNILYGNGVFAAVPNVSNVATANFANYAGNVTIASQPNITSVGNLVSLTVNNGIANAPTYEFNPNGVSVGSFTPTQVVSNGAASVVTARHSYNYDSGNGAQFVNQDLVTDGTNVVIAGSQQTFAYGTPGTAAIPAIYTMSVAEGNSDLNTAGNPATYTTMQIGQGGQSIIVGAQTNTPSMALFHYGNTTQNQSTALRVNRRRGNGAARTNVVANDYLGNIEWRGAGGATGAINSGFATFGAKVDSTYGGPGNIMPIGMEMVVINSSNSQLTHNFYANGNVSFAGNISAPNLGNVSALNLDGNAGNILYGNGVFAASPSVSLTGDGGNLSNLQAANVVGTVDSANVASYINVSNANSSTVANFLVPFVSSNTGNGTVLVDTSVGITYNPGQGKLFVGTYNGSGAELTNIPGANVTGTVANANNSAYAGNVTIASQANITSVGNLVSVQIGNLSANTVTTQIVPAGTNVAALSGNLLSSTVKTSTDTEAAIIAGAQLREAVITPFTTASGFGETYTTNYLVQDLANTANIAVMGSVAVTPLTYGAGNSAAASQYTISTFTNDSNLATADTNTNLEFTVGSGGLFVNQKMPNSNNVPAGGGVVNVLHYGEASNPPSATAMRVQRRRGNNVSRQAVQANDYLGNIAWRGAGGATGAVNSGNVTFGAKVDGSYGGPGNVMPIGLELNVINSSNATLTHSFYANGDVSFAGNIISSIPGGSSISNGNSSVSFTGSGGDVLINIDSTQYATFSSNRNFILDGIEADSSNAAKISINNGGIGILTEDLGGGFPSFDFKSYYSTGFIAPYTFYRARGNINSPSAVQGGDAITTQSYIVYGDSGNTFVNVGTYSVNVINNDNAGNVQSRIEIATARNDNGSEVKLNADRVVIQGNSEIQLNAPTNMGAGSLFAVSAFTASALTAITGSVGQVAAVQDQGGKLAYWDTGNSRWSYVFDNSAV